MSYVHLIVIVIIVILLNSDFIQSYNMIISKNFKSKTDNIFILSAEINSDNNSIMSDNSTLIDGNYVRLKGNNGMYEVQLPKGMNVPILSPKEQKIIDMKEAKQSKPSDSDIVDGNTMASVPSDLDILREQLRLLLEKMS